MTQDMVRPTDDPKGTTLQMRVSAAYLKSIDEWRRQQPDLPSRSEAIRRLTAAALTAHTPEPKAVGRLRERVASATELAAKAVDSLTVGAADADEKASRKRRRTRAKGK